MKRFLAGTALCAIAATGASSAQAQTAPSTDISATDDANTIVVTAQRRTQSAQEVGIALSVVSGGELLKRGITQINDLQQAVPNLEIEPAFGSGQAQFRIRGVGFTDYASNNSPTVGVYVNEVAYPLPIMTQGLLFDISRVEVLRGPQGTLYGRNTTGGAINFITNKPSATLGAGITTEFGKDDQLHSEAYVTGPLADGVSFRIAAATDQGGAFQHNRVTGQSLGDADRVGTRGLLDLDSGAFSALIDVHAGYDKSENVGLYLLDPFTTSITPGVPGPVIPADVDHTKTGWDIPADLAQYIKRSDGRPGKNNSTLGSSLNASYLLAPTIKVTSITSYDKLIRREYGDYDASSSIEADVFFGSRVHTFSEELRLSSNGSGPFTWVAGIYYSYQKLDEQYYSDFQNLFGIYARVNYAQEARSISGFGQGEYALSQKLKVIGGLRYEHEDRKLLGFGSSFGGRQALVPTDVTTAMSPLSGKAELDYKPTHNLLFYTSFSKGVKSGGFTTYNTGNSAAIQAFKPETLYAYEVGIKSDLSRAVQLNVSSFYYDYRNQQVQDYVCGANGAVGRFTNANKSRIYGFEGDARITPAAGFSFSPYASFKSGKFLDFNGLDLPYCRSTLLTRYIDKSGTRIAFPQVEFGGTLAYEFGAGDRYTLTPSATFSYRNLYYSPLHIDRYNIPGYFLLNGDLTLAPRHGRWTAAIWGRNILNKQYDLTRNFFTNADVAQPGRPASYGMRVGLKM